MAPAFQNFEQEPSVSLATQQRALQRAELTWRPKKSKLIGGASIGLAAVFSVGVIATVMTREVDAVTPHLENARTAFVLLGALGDNSCRPNGLWSGLFEAWCAGVFQQGGQTHLHGQFNKGVTEDEIYAKVMQAIRPRYKKLRKASSWKCRAPHGNCSPDIFFRTVHINIWTGLNKFNADGQAANMSYLAEYERVIAYLSLPPFAYSSWSLAIVKNWGGGSKVHIAVEKPFGGGRDSVQEAADLYNSIMKSGLPETSLHLVDHWLHFFMIRNLHTFRKIVEHLLGIQWTGKYIEKIVVIEYELRGFGGRGSFINGLGQVRDMIQSHLLQVLALIMQDLAHQDFNSANAKMKIFDSLTLEICEPWQFEGLLESKGMTFHPDFADSSYARMHLKSSLDEWQDVDLVIQTGKAMDVNMYAIEVYQRGGPGVLTFDIGKEEAGLGDVKVANWPLKKSRPFKVPVPGFHHSPKQRAKPQVSKGGHGIILEYTDGSLYFPQSYARIAWSLIMSDYTGSFVTWPECQKCWDIVTGSSPHECLDPPPEKVQIYLPAFLCDKTPPHMCDQHETVQDMYDSKFECTPEHDDWYKDVDIYQAKCHPP